LKQNGANPHTLQYPSNGAVTHRAKPQKQLLAENEELPIGGPATPTRSTHKMQAQTIQGINGFTTGYTKSDVPSRRTQAFKLALSLERKSQNIPLRLTESERKLVANADEIVPENPEVKYCTNVEKTKKLVRYHYSNDLRSLYAKDFDKRRAKKLVGGKPEIFSEERERAKLPMQGRSTIVSTDFKKKERERNA